MLMYQRNQTKSKLFEKLKNIKEIDLIPNDIKNEILEQNKKYLEEFNEWEDLQDDTEVVIYFEGREYKKKYFKDSNINDILIRFLNEHHLFDIEKFRIRNFKNFSNLIPGKIYLNKRKTKK
jgi:hypothetical protein